MRKRGIACEARIFEEMTKYKTVDSFAAQIRR
jgi:hypothetical protein